MREAKRTAGCCDYIATPWKSPISCDPDSQFGWHNQGKKQKKSKVSPRQGRADGLKPEKVTLPGLQVP
ncbi:MULTISPECIES: hypothetical protein [unclassified Methanosarcina]|uniref:hypothetical protein n=1 Tax=unclassified Methanosarcina TaxID=2644672 RepID=UPI000AAF0052|nr:MULTISPECIES: hypothetical protein [unclassified Methanosarcina]